MKVSSLENIPDRATIVDEFTSCGNPDCHERHGPYKYARWKEKGHLKKVYIGKSLEDLRFRLLCEQAHDETGLSVTDAKKCLIIGSYAQDGNPVARLYLEKVSRKQCSPDWAFRKLREHLQLVTGRRIRPRVRLTPNRKGHDSALSVT